MPITKLGDEKYLVTVGSRTQRIRETFFGTKANARKHEAKLRLVHAARFAHRHQTAPPFSSFCLGPYRTHARLHLGDGTWRNRKYQVATAVEFFGDTPLDRISPALIAEFQAHRLATKHKRSGKTPSNAKVNDDCKVLSAILGYAKEIGALERAPDWKRLPEKRKEGRVRPWTNEQVERLYLAAQDECPELVPMIAVMINCGLRRGEVMAMEWSWVDTRRGLLLVHPCEDWQPKNGKPREVPLGQAVTPWLEKPDGAGRYVFTTRKRVVRGKVVGGSRYARWPDRKWRRAVKSAGIHGSPHTARHTFASHFLARQPDLYLLAQVMGHSHTRVTELYSHLLPEHLERARDAVNLPVPRPRLGLVP